MNDETNNKRKRYDVKTKEEETKKTIADYREKTKGKQDYKIKYIGETSRSVYERAKEHWNAFRDLSIQSHMLKHYFLEHEDIEMADMEFGIRVTGTYTSAIERQIAEAVKIEKEVKKGKKLLNSKSEFNRCELPRLKIGTRKQTLQELQEDDDETRKWKDKLRKLKKRKKDERIEEEMSNPSLRRVCLEILNEDNRAWNAKKRRIEVEKKAIDEEEESQRKRMLRLAEAEKKKRELLKSLRFKGNLKPTEKERRAIEQRKRYWRSFREPKEDFSVDETTLEAGNINSDDAGCDAAASNFYTEKEMKKKPGEAEREGRKDIGYPETLCLKNPRIINLNLDCETQTVTDLEQNLQVTQTVPDSKQNLNKTQTVPNLDQNLLQKSQHTVTQT